MHAQQLVFQEKEKFDAETQPTFDHTFQPPPPRRNKKNKKDNGKLCLFCNWKMCRVRQMVFPRATFHWTFERPLHLFFRCFVGGAGVAENRWTFDQHRSRFHGKFIVFSRIPGGARWHVFWDMCWICCLFCHLKSAKFGLKDENYGEGWWVWIPFFFLRSALVWGWSVFLW